jgi:hypothetical protein
MTRRLPSPAQTTYLLACQQNDAAAIAATPMQTRTAARCAGWATADHRITAMGRDVLRQMGAAVAA